MRLGINIDHLRIPEERQATALCKIINSADRHFLQSILRELEIPGRTRIYNLFGWSHGLYNSTREEYEEHMAGRDDRQREAARTILEHSDFRIWAKKYMMYYNIQHFLNVFSSTGINLDGFDIRVVREAIDG